MIVSPTTLFYLRNANRENWIVDNDTVSIYKYLIDEQCIKIIEKDITIIPDMKWIRCRTTLKGKWILFLMKDIDDSAC